MRESLYAYCLRSGETDLLAQWDQGDNGRSMTIRIRCSHWPSSRPR